jgi:hypothetical protein
VAQTINSANYVYFQALDELLKLDNPLVLKIYTGQLLRKAIHIPPTRQTLTNTLFFTWF